MKKLNTFGVEAGDRLVQPEQFADITVDSPALAILTDFRSHQAHTIGASVPATDAAALLMGEGSSVKLVVDKNRDLVGLVTLDHLSDQRILTVQVERHLARSEVLVSDLMQPRAAMLAIDYADFQRATVEDIVATLQGYEQPYYIVVDRAEHHIRGVISSGDIARRLHRPVSIGKSPTFVDIFSAVRGLA